MIGLWKTMKPKVGMVVKLTTFLTGNPPRTLGVCINTHHRGAHFIFENGNIVNMSNTVPKGLAMSEMDMFFENIGINTKISKYKFVHSDKTAMEYDAGFFNDALKRP